MYDEDAMWERLKDNHRQADARRVASGQVANGLVGSLTLLGVRIWWMGRLAIHNSRRRRSPAAR